MLKKTLPVRPRLLEGFGEAEYVASGSSCDVYRVCCEGREYALKVMDCGNNPERYRRAMDEVLLQWQVEGRPNLVELKCYETMEHCGSRYVFLLQSYMPTLEGRYMANPMTVADVIKLGMDLCEALLQCQNVGVAHLDVQPKNVFLGEDGNWKLGDFGSAAWVKDLPHIRDLRGTLSYMAPEVYYERRYSPKSDSYALGILLYSLINQGNLPFGRHDTKENAIQRRLNNEVIPGLQTAGDALNQCILRACMPGCRLPDFEVFRQGLLRAMEATPDDVLRQVVNPWTRPDVKKNNGKTSLLKKIFGKGNVEKKHAPERLQQRQMFIPDVRRDQAVQIINDDELVTTCPMGISAPQIFDDDECAMTCPMDISAPQIFNDDECVMTCPMDITAPQIFNDDECVMTCPMDITAPQFFNDDECVATCPMENPAVQIPERKAPARQLGGYEVQKPNYPGKSVPVYPGCGAPTALRMDQVQFSALAPKGVEPNDSFLINIFMYQEAFRQVVDEAIAQSDGPLQDKTTGFHKVRENTQVKIVLTSPDVAIEDNMYSQIWTGGYLTFDFFVYLPENYVKKQVLLKAEVYFDNVPATRLMLAVKVQAQQNAPVTVSRQDIRSAFVSYASEDRARVASLIQGMSKIRPDLDIFFDVSSLASGQRWEKQLYLEIDTRDILFLCWSQNARNSPWVEREWKYAIQTKGVDAVEPIPLEQPDVCPPPRELSGKHFNDMLLYIINR